MKSLTPGELDDLEVSYRRIHAQLPRHIEAFYESLFERHPDFRPLFRGEPELQARKLAVALALVVANMQSPEMMPHALVWLRDRHARARVSAEDFAPFVDTLLESLGTAHGPGWEAGPRAAWGKALHQVADAMKSDDTVPSRSRKRAAAHAYEATAPEGLSNAAVELVESSYSRLLADVQLFDRFYRRLFFDHPELVPLFSEDRLTQQRKLSLMIALVVGHLRDLERLRPMFADLGRRHAAAGVSAEHYAPFIDSMCQTIAHSLAVDEEDDTVRAWRAALERVASVMS